MFEKLRLETGFDSIEDLLDLWVNIENVNTDLHDTANIKSDRIEEL